MRALLLSRYAAPLYALHTLSRARQVERKIADERRYYANVVAPTNTAPLAIRLQDRLSQRGVRLHSPHASPIHILYATRPSDWEPHNIPPELAKVGTYTTYYYQERGFDDSSRDWIAQRSRLDADLLEFVRRVHRRKPIQLFLSYLSGWQVSPDTIRAIGALGIVTCAFHWDDTLSFRGTFAGGRWSGPAALAAALDLNLTSAPSSIAKYEAEGGLAMFWPEAANPDHFRPLDCAFDFDVTFVGACYGYRPTMIKFLSRRGISVEAFGSGWPRGPIPETDVARLYSRSRINLGFGGIGYSTSALHLKGRDFEVPMCGALYLTSDNPELSLVYDVGQEIEVYRDKFDCLNKIRELLTSPARAEAIRHAARSRCLREHTWERRLRALLETCGLLVPDERPTVEPPDRADLLEDTKMQQT